MATSTLQTTVQNRVSAYINRTVSELTVNTLPLALDAMSMAKKEAQRRANFKQCRQVGYISTSMSGAAMSTITSDSAGTTPLVVKYIEQMWTYVTNNGGNYRAMYVPPMTLGDQKLEYPVSTQSALLWPAVVPANSYQNLPQTLRWWQQGTTVYVNGVFTPAQTFLLDVVAYLPAYDGTTATDDWIITNCDDWLFVATIDYMNMFLKEDARIPISEKKKQFLWDGVCAYDEQVTEGALGLDQNS